MTNARYRHCLIWGDDMAIRPVRELPVRRGGFAAREPFVEADMREFVRKGMDVAVLEYDGRKAGAIVSACRRYIKAHPRECAGVRCGKRGDHIYVWREVVR